jgi:hypothetical protein
MTITTVLVITRLQVTAVKLRSPSRAVHNANLNILLTITRPKLL